MKELICEVDTVMKKELAHVTQKYGAQHASAHEAYAVLLEEVDECEEALSTLIARCGGLRGIHRQNV